MSMYLRFLFSLLFAFATFSKPAFATTWDEPWADQVIKNADSFVLATVDSFDADKGVSIIITKTLAGNPLNGKINITDFYLLDLTSSSGGHGAEFDLDEIKQSYFFIKKNSKGAYCIATPTSGFDYIKEGNVIANYRHSYHKSLVPVDVYEKTMTAIFNHYHNQPYDNNYINGYVNKYLALQPAGFDEAGINTFFVQHVALECVYHLRLPDRYTRILPFLNDLSNVQNQISGARALIASNTIECKQELMKVITDRKREHFVQVICVWTLAAFQPTELKAQLIKARKRASEEHSGFGGNLMDPRVGTYFPTVKSALDKLIQSLPG